MRSAKMRQILQIIYCKSCSLQLGQILQACYDKIDTRYCSEYNYLPVILEARMSLSARINLNISFKAKNVSGALS